MKEINFARELNDYRKGYTTKDLYNRRNVIKLKAELDRVQKRARVRTIKVRDVLYSLARLEKGLDVQKRYLEGLKVRIDCNAKNYANSYNGIPFSTQFEAEYRNGWKITDIERCKARRNGKGHRVEIIAISDEAKEKIFKNTIAREINYY